MSKVAPIKEREDSAPRATISVELVNKILNQFASMPYVQVVEIISQIQQDVTPIEDQGDGK